VSQRSLFDDPAPPVPSYWPGAAPWLADYGEDLRRKAKFKERTEAAQQAMTDNFPPQTQEAARAWVKRNPGATAGEAAQVFRLRDATAWFRLLWGGL
jgi:hypothetical protein